MPAKSEKKIARQGGAVTYRTMKKGGSTFTCAITKKKGPQGGKSVCWKKH